MLHAHPYSAFGIPERPVTHYGEEDRVERKGADTSGVQKKHKRNPDTGTENDRKTPRYGKRRRKKHCRPYANGLCSQGLKEKKKRQIIINSVKFSAGRIMTRESYLLFDIRQAWPRSTIKGLLSGT